MKIHDAPLTKEQEKQIKQQQIESDYISYEHLSDIIENTYDNFSTKTFTLRLNQELEPMLRVYADSNNISIAKSIELICESFFKDKFVTRNFFKLEKIMNIAIPLDVEILGEYIQKQINPIIEINEDIKERVQTKSIIIDGESTKNYLVARFSIGNNYLDMYKDDRYYANSDKSSDYHYVPLFNEYQLQENHHIGLFKLYVEHYKQSIFLAVLYDDKKPIDARFISREFAINEAMRVNNLQVQSYLQDTSSDIMQRYHHEVKERNMYIKSLENHVKSLELENKQLTNKLKDIESINTENIDSEYTSTIEKLEKENDALSEQLRLLSPEQQRIINDATTTINKYLKLYNHQLDQIKK